MTRTADDHRPTVLIIEDEPLIALMLENVLSAVGYHPEWRPNARHLATSAEPAAAIVDLGLGGGLDGRDVVLRLRRERPALPIVVLTGFAAAAPQADLRGLGGPTARLHKPQDLDELPQRLAELLTGAIERVSQRRRKADRTALAAA